jgi:hypothetical protein
MAGMAVAVSRRQRAADADHVRYACLNMSCSGSTASAGQSQFGSEMPHRNNFNWTYSGRLLTQ